VNTAKATGGASEGAVRPLSGFHSLTAPDYDLDSTLSCGQAFRWHWIAESQAWIGVVGEQCVRLQTRLDRIEVESAPAAEDWAWLRRYLQTDLHIDSVLRSFPDDAPMRAAVSACRGLRLLRQDPWECLASFILSSTKQIVQIRRIIALLCERYGKSITVPAGWMPAHTFPSAARLAEVSETDLRQCKMGFRAKYLRGSALRVAKGDCELTGLGELPTDLARVELMRLPGVGRKVADCVLLFAYGRLEAFPMDVWMIRGLGQLYFPRRQVSLDRLRRFADTHFGPQGGFAQQYLFHYLRMEAKVPKL